MLQTQDKIRQTVESLLPSDKWANPPSLGQRKPQISQVHPASTALHHSLLKPPLLSPATNPSLCPEQLPPTPRHILPGSHGEDDGGRWTACHLPLPLPGSLHLQASFRPFSAPRPSTHPAHPNLFLLGALLLSNTLISPGSFWPTLRCNQVSSNVKTANTKPPKLPLVPTKPPGYHSLPAPRTSQTAQRSGLISAKTPKAFSGLSPTADGGFVQLTCLQWLGAADRHSSPGCGRVFLV